MSKDIAVIDYGLGNLRSVSKALELAGAEVTVTSDPAHILSAKGVVLPGVGAFYKGIENLKAMKLFSVVQDIIKSNIPFLGICLGLQLLFSQSEEHGITPGLGVIEGGVKRFKGEVKIPHMGWNQINIVKKNTPLFEGVPDRSFFYFVHSYFVQPQDEAVILATTAYSGEFVSAVNKGNVFGVQFHPEKSSSLGLLILRNFVGMLN